MTESLLPLGLFFFAKKTKNEKKWTKNNSEKAREKRGRLAHLAPWPFLPLSLLSSLFAFSLALCPNMVSRYHGYA
jgi:hypothetical protein